MGEEAIRDIETIALAIVGLAVLVALVSRQSNTAGVINAGSSAFNTAIATADAPITGYNVGAPIYSGTGFGLPTLPDISAGYNNAFALGSP
jgi:hypothetical protein